MIILETGRLTLRTWEKSDIGPMTTINQDPKVCEYLPKIGSRKTTQAFINHNNECYDKYGFCLYAAVLKSNNELIGFIGLNIPSFEAHFTPAVEIGWRLSSNYWCKGYATEAATAILHYAFTVLDINEIVSFTVINNKSSRRVMEKIGMHYNPNDDFDHPKLAKDSPLKKHVLYRITKSDYFKAINHE